MVIADDHNFSTCGVSLQASIRASINKPKNLVLSFYDTLISIMIPTLPRLTRQAPLTPLGSQVSKTGTPESLSERNLLDRRLVALWILKRAQTWNTLLIREESSI